VRPLSKESLNLEERVAAGERPGPPPLEPFGLVLHHDARWSHEGQPILNRKLREKFDRSVVYLPDEAKYVVRVGHFRGQIEIEEAGFFVRAIELEAGDVLLSDGSRESLRVETLRPSPMDGAMLCQVKTGLVAGGVPARFSLSAQAELLGGVEPAGEGFVLILGSGRVDLPEALTPGSSLSD
jgi:hypothetical protein